ncbi:hypothetical protein FF36_06425 [Frankia torreyi]|uniref:Uncharacterized protein n=1 Tax=Frankia torreyi TaxID=1856 RepID=A0A0D8B7F5_9ACTN|nr:MULTISPECIES: hypothetical protein [Frankia]KJE19302.1 hypothetical protein FF36_06425 [Frankia torreyi]KQM01711.1 hypothetical protein FF86_11243 [Frankia sp. CpI1-P]
MPDLQQRVLIILRDADAPTRPAELASTQMAPYFPDGCPPTRPAGLARPAHYQPHADTVCPACIASWSSHHVVSDPATVPDPTPPALRFTWTTAWENDHTALDD